MSSTIVISFHPVEVHFIDEDRESDISLLRRDLAEHNEVSRDLQQRVMSAIAGAIEAWAITEQTELSFSLQVQQPIRPPYPLIADASIEPF